MWLRPDLLKPKPPLNTVQKYTLVSVLDGLSVFYQLSWNVGEEWHRHQVAMHGEPTREGTNPLY